jgi:hypothetical protein
VKTAAIALVLCAATPASAEPEARCAKGKQLAEQNDLPRAALYLDSCTDDDGVRVRNQVVHALEATRLSPLTITSMPAGLPGTTDALPGETFTTPATIWAKAGTYTITVGGQTVAKTLEPHSRTTVIINIPTPPKPAKNGVVDFEEEPEQHQGAPPAVKHGTLMPKKYLEKQAPSGEQLEDPFARRGDSVLAWRFGARIGGGLYDRTSESAGLGFSLAALASRPLDGPFRLATRLDWSHKDLDTIGANAGVSVVALARRAFVLSAGVAMRGEVHLQDTLAMTEVNRASIGAAADVDVAVMALPLALGLRVEQGFSELMPGVRGRAVVFELGYDWR